MTRSLAPVDAEGATVAYLKPRLADARVATRLPTPLPARPVRVTRAGGDGRNLVQSDVRLLIECFADDDVTAWAVASRAHAHLRAAEDSYLAPGVWVAAISLSEPVNFPDTSVAKKARYQFVAQMTTSLAEIELEAP